MSPLTSFTVSLLSMLQLLMLWSQIIRYLSNYLLDFYFLLSYALMFSCFFPRNSMADSVPFCLMQVYRSALRLVRSMVQFIYSISKSLFCLVLLPYLIVKVHVAGGYEGWGFSFLNKAVHGYIELLLQTHILEGKELDSPQEFKPLLNFVSLINNVPVFFLVHFSVLDAILSNSSSCQCDFVLICLIYHAVTFAISQSGIFDCSSSKQRHCTTQRLGEVAVHLESWGTPAGNSDNVHSFFFFLHPCPWS